MKTSLLVTLLTLSCFLGLRAQDTTKADDTFHKLLAAQETRNYEAFVADGTDQLKAALGKGQFEAACNLLDPRLKVGYDVTLLGELNQKGYEVYLYRLRFKDTGDDMLGTLSLKDGKVGGIVFR